MKTKLLFLFFFIYCTASTITFATNFSNINLVNMGSSDKKEEILLAGTLETGMVKSLFIPFEVWKTPVSIDITYLRNLTNIDVEIKNESGQSFYHSTVNPVNGEQLSISITGWDAGNYTITFSDGKGGCVYGAFTI